MAIVLLGRTKCPLCAQVIEHGQPIVGFSNEFQNEADPLWLFNDAAFHSQCFHAHPLAQQALARANERREQTGPGHRNCRVCGQDIATPDEYLCLGHLTADAADPLFAHNYAQFHYACLPLWPALASTYKQLQAQKEAGLWRGKGIDWLLTQLREALKQ